ncbi:hypothetical protein DPMN_127168 [Dreissena polymorpha]|uniref:Reverse transcriptase domain-containing protein n=1 Tax=Dreissena polymorpha TaxID=45954 RepID=A0A9D4GYH7_DREPO|nr:hypothetical protein DPMN_127168 [Dreissena polymorpha]
MFNIGVTDRHWTLIDSFHRDSVCSIKWRGSISTQFRVNQDVRQGGVLRTDLYKCYVNPLLNCLQESGIGSSIGDIRCAASACADDISICATSAAEAQALLNTSAKFVNIHDIYCSQLSRYTLKLVISVQNLQKTLL